MSLVGVASDQGEKLYQQNQEGHLSAAGDAERCCCCRVGVPETDSTVGTGLQAADTARASRRLASGFGLGRAQRTPAAFLPRQVVCPCLLQCRLEALATTTLSVYIATARACLLECYPTLLPDTTVSVDEAKKDWT